MTTPRPDSASSRRALVAVFGIFLLSGFSGLTYQVIWVRWFGHLFGNTLYSASIVTGVFMGGLGLGSYFAGLYIDRQRARGPAFPLRAYGVCELAIGALGLLLALLLPAMEPLSAAISSYGTDADGWHVLTTGSYVLRYLMALVLLLPVTTVMGATLTLLIRYLLASHLEDSGWRVGALYGFNTAGAALGAFLSDFALIPAVGLFSTQLVAVGLNLIAALAAFKLAQGAVGTLAPSSHEPAPDAPSSAEPSSGEPSSDEPSSDEPSSDEPASVDGKGSVAAVGLAIALSGFAAMGIEIVWFRHLSIALGGLREVFSLLLTVVLVGIWLGALLGGWAHRKLGHAARLYMVSQAGFLLLAILLLAGVDATSADTAEQARILAAGAGEARFLQTWVNFRPIVAIVALPALLMGFAYPLANAQIQSVEGDIGRRAGLLYLANTAGAVAGSLVAGLLLIPRIGMYPALTVLAGVGVLAIVPLLSSSVGGLRNAARQPRDLAVAALSLLVAGGAVLWWSQLPPHPLLHKGVPEGATVLDLSEGPYELVLITEETTGRRLMTNGYLMSGTEYGAQRYMRSFSHVPLLHMDEPTDALIICHGVGITLHAATLHPSLERIDLVDLSRNVLEQAHWFEESNRGSLKDPRVQVHVNDGRQHLWMQPEGSYDLITLEPPPIGMAGVASLYSQDFYELSRSRLKEGGYFAQWLPAYQLDEEVVRAMVRSFVEVFPEGVMLSGDLKELLLIGTKDGPPILDIDRVQRLVAANPALRDDLQAVDLTTPLELVGSYFASAESMRRATEFVPAVTDDHPSMEYSLHGKVRRTRFPADMMDTTTVATWCPGCFDEGGPVPGLELLGDYLLYLTSYYVSEDFLAFQSRDATAQGFDLLAPVDKKALAGASGYLRKRFNLEP